MKARDVQAGTAVLLDGCLYAVTEVTAPRTDTGEVLLTAVGPGGFEHDFVLPGSADVVTLAAR